MSDELILQTTNFFVHAVRMLLTQEDQSHSSIRNATLELQSLYPVNLAWISRNVRSTVPITGKFQSSISLPCANRLYPLRDSIRNIEPVCSWRQNPGYSAQLLGDHFMKNYGYFEIVGPTSLIKSRQLAVGVLLLGEGVRYPEHAHPATEVYYPICGEALWSQSGSKPKRRASGEFIYHASNEIHAMETVEQPLVALYLWIGDISTPAHLT